MWKFWRQALERIKELMSFLFKKSKGKQRKSKERKWKERKGKENRAKQREHIKNSKSARATQTHQTKTSTQK